MVSASYNPLNGSPDISLCSFGAFFVHPGYRKTGLGLAMTLWAEEWLRQERFRDSNVAICSADGMLAGYQRRYPTAIKADWRIELIKVPIQDVDSNRLSNAGAQGKRFLGKEDLDWAQIEQYDKEICGGLRRIEVLRRLITSEKSWPKAVINPEGRLVGLDCLRESIDEGLLVGPLFADSPEIAGALLKSLLESVPSLHSGCYTRLHFVYPSTNRTGVVEMVGRLSADQWQENAYSHVLFRLEPLKVGGREERED